MADSTLPLEPSMETDSRAMYELYSILKLKYAAPTNDVKVEIDHLPKLIDVVCVGDRPVFPLRYQFTSPPVFLPNGILLARGAGVCVFVQTEPGVYDTVFSGAGWRFGITVADILARCEEYANEAEARKRTLDEKEREYHEFGKAFALRIYLKKKAKVQAWLDATRPARTNEASSLPPAPSEDPHVDR